MRAKHPQDDRNFDGLVGRFQRNVYHSLKGRLRLAVLKRDFDEHVSAERLSVLEVGAGQGYWALELLARGHRVMLTDISSEMLSFAHTNLSGSDVSPQLLSNARWLQAPAQDLSAQLNETFDMVVCHAMLEWVNEPESLLASFQGLLNPGGWLSLVFYNVHGLVYKNLLRANYKKIDTQDFRGARGSLTPANPLDPLQVVDWLTKGGYEIVCYSGIRVFHDYILDPVARQKDPDAVIRLELAMSRHETYRNLGRYIHLLCRKLPV